MMGEIVTIPAARGELETKEECYMPRYTEHTLTKWRTDTVEYNRDDDGVDITYHFEVYKRGMEVHKGTYTMFTRLMEGRHMMKVIHMLFASSDFQEHPVSEAQMKYYTSLAAQALKNV